MKTAAADPMRAAVGIVVRTKDRPWFLRRTLDDVLAQTMTDWALSIVNDGGDVSAVDRLIAELPDDVRAKVTVRHNESAAGRPAAANQGVRALDTDFVVLHDDDDLWSPDFLSKTSTYLDDHVNDIGVMVRTEIVYEVAEGDGFVETGRVPFWPDLVEITYSDLLQVNRAVPISYLYRRRLHEDVGWYREDLHAAEDWEFNLRTTLTHHVGFIGGKPLAFWMQRRGVSGDLGNSMFVLADDHDHYDRLVRDEALRDYVLREGPGLPLFLARYIQDEVGRQLDDRRSLAQRLTSTVRDWRRDRRAR